MVYFLVIVGGMQKLKAFLAIGCNIPPNVTDDGLTDELTFGIQRECDTYTGSIREYNSRTDPDCLEESRTI